MAPATGEPTTSTMQQESQPNAQQEPDYKALALLVGVDSHAAANLDDLDGEELEDFIDELDDCKIMFEQVDIAKHKLQKLAELKRKLKLADQAPRCTHIKSDGLPCRSAAMKGDQFCYFHGEARSQREAEKAREIPVLDGPHAVQLAIMRVCSLLANERSRRKQRGFSLMESVSRRKHSTNILSVEKRFPADSR